MNLFSGCFDYTLGNQIRGERQHVFHHQVFEDKAKSALSAAAAAGLLALVALPGAVEASSSPFTAMSGSWSGSGTITTSSGTKERIRCRAKYDVDGAGSNLDLTLRCASDSYNFELQSNVTHSNGAVSGTWSENTRRVGGNIEGSARGNAHQRAGVGHDLGDARASAPTPTSSRSRSRRPAPKCRRSRSR